MAFKYFFIVLFLNAYEHYRPLTIFMRRLLRSRQPGPSPAPRRRCPAPVLNETQINLRPGTDLNPICELSDRRWPAAGRPDITSEFH
ncbi:hypothetical protein EVAR_2468_1 [Eumeta japonica]|uniref:Uncharacterized protein n=1 Tax=Eumeta variegata TaxID=151549 RepID=A0A4C1SNE8_EUMVA|nr:hypothetical protein EVAR_2468_1 [Eumeta japonica]